ncbi:MAG: phage tail protein, partial [Deltaproteobacteria bacterium]|nr:phage tail protein [Deltaproteobacteria bacterium]
AGWFFTNALPERLVGPGLNARSNEIAIETLELSHEGLLRLPVANLPQSV